MADDDGGVFPVGRPGRRVPATQHCSTAPWQQQCKCSSSAAAPAARFLGALRFHGPFQDPRRTAPTFSGLPVLQQALQQAVQRAGVPSPPVVAVVAAVLAVPPVRLPFSGVTHARPPRTAPPLPNLRFARGPRRGRKKKRPQNNCSGHDDGRREVKH